jgi:hypothetical protein
MRDLLFRAKELFAAASMLEEVTAIMDRAASGPAV